MPESCWREPAGGWAKTLSIEARTGTRRNSRRAEKQEFRETKEKRDDDSERKD
jgi:hypothetical protein